MNDPELLEETILRRALRLEADERPARFDAAAIAAAAGRPRLALVGVLAATALVAVAAVAVWSTVALLLPAVLSQVFDVGLEAIAVLAVPATTIAELVQQPVVPLSLLVALAIATAFELRERDIAHASVR
ncbi:MAG TPA: hypothetical protein VJP45_03910 [Candidatus Limnocylindria bacterium]|nr:hypothetical protein [Candidatus Limnocylindria bacterium]